MQTQPHISSSIILLPKNQISKKMKVLLVLLSLAVAIQGAPNPIPPPIVGGEDAAPGEFPYMVSFHYKGSHLCGGAIVTNDYVLSAAHCCVYGGGIKSTFSVVAGEHILSRAEGHEQKSEIEEVIVYPEYNPIGTKNDICLLKLSTRFNLSSPYLETIELAAPTDDPTGDAVVTGWGDTREGAGQLSDILQKVTVPIVTNEKCSKSYENSGYSITDAMICAGLENGGKDSCQSDSGGPMVAVTDGRVKIVGVVSWGYGCARPGFPGVYARVSKFTNWINQIISSS